MDQRLWLSEEPCFGHDPEYGVTPPKKRRKTTLKRGQTSLLLFFLGFAAISLYMAHTSPITGTSAISWGVGFVLSAVLALYVFTHDGRPDAGKPERRRKKYGTID